MSKSSEYNSYIHAKRRCNDKNDSQYFRYAGRGIKFLFKNFEEFYAELGDKPEPKDNYSIERVDNSGNYEIGNIRWAIAKEQARNTRQNRFITINDKTYCVSEWAEIMNVSNKMIDRRLNKYGWCDYCSVTIEPYGGKCSHA